MNKLYPENKLFKVLVVINNRTSNGRRKGLFGPVQGESGSVVHARVYDRLQVVLHLVLVRFVVASFECAADVVAVEMNWIL